MRPYSSIPIAKLVLRGSIDGADHVREVAHAQVDSAGLAEKAVVEVLLIGLGDGGGFTDRVAVLTLCVAVPHGVQGLLASKEIVSLILHHLGVADLNTDSVIGALTVAVTKQTDFTRAGDHTLDIDADVVLATSPLLEVQFVVHELIVVSLWVSTHIFIICYSNN